MDPRDLGAHLPDRLARIQDFLIACDAFKRIERRNYLTDGSRLENDAEHTWHMALYAVLLHGELAEDVDLGHVLSMILVHDLVEIHAGDTFAYDEAGRADQAEREEEAARRLFGRLPADLAARIDGLWREFEVGEAAAARVARQLDRLPAVAQNIASDGKAHRQNGVTRTKTRGRMAETLDGDPTLARLAEALYAHADARGLWLPEEGEA